MTWLPAETIIAGDVIRFREIVWGHKKGRRLGRILIVGQIKGAGEVLTLDVIGSSVIEDFGYGRHTLLVRKGDEINRKRAVVERWGKPERWAWSDESARDVALKSPLPETAYEKKPTLKPQVHRAPLPSPAPKLTL